MSVRIALGGRHREAAERAVARFVRDRVASRIAAQDAGLWDDGEAPSLAWTESLADSAAVIDRVREARHRMRHAHVRRAVVPAPTGATLAAAMIARTAGLDVDSDTADLDGAVVAVDDRAGADAERSADALRAAGTDDARTVRFDAGGLTGADGALSPAALVPAGLAGADLQELLDEAQSEALNLAIDDPANNGLLLGAALAAADGSIGFVADGTHVIGFPVWAARLLGELGGGAAHPDEQRTAGRGADGSDSASPRLLVRLVEDAGGADPGDDVLVSGTLGELILLLLTAATVATLPDRA